MRESVEYLFVEHAARDSAIAARVIERFPGAHIEYCDPMRRASIGRTFARAPRKALYLRHHKGSFIKPFPRHPWYDGGGGVYYNLILGYNCFGGCHYCFIQSIFDDAIPTMYANRDDLANELTAFLRSEPRAWMSTGEYIDSLQLDEVTGYTEFVMDVMRRFPNATLELRTKSGRVDHLPADPPVAVTVAYSISPPDVAGKVEPGTAPLERRLVKARVLHDKGYRIAVRIDPIIATPKFADGYSLLPNIIDTHLGWRRVGEVFLGALRFDDALLKRMSRSTAARRLLDAEFVACPDGRYRPLKATRSRIYRDIVERIRRYQRDMPVTIMMEPEYIRRAAMR